MTRKMRICTDKVNRFFISPVRIIRVLFNTINLRTKVEISYTLSVIRYTAFHCVQKSYNV